MNTAGGTHHAYRDRGEGFCVFNDVAVAINVARREFADALRDRKILVIDLDVHQGNGTAKIFEGDAQVVTFSMHGERTTPSRRGRNRRTTSNCRTIARMRNI